MNRLTLWFGSTVIVGVFLSVVPARVYTTLKPEQIQGTQTLSEFEKVYVDQFSDRIKWLETIAYAALGGIVGLRWSQEKLINHPAIAMSAGCLVVSLFNGYSAHDQVLQALQLHTPMLLSAAVSRLTVICQFWSLAVGVALLATRLLSVSKGAHRKTLVALVMIALSLPTFAQDNVKAPHPEPSIEDCVSNWTQTRFHDTAKQKDLALLGRIVTGTAKAKRIDLNAENRCVFTASILDFVLNASYTLNGDRDYAAFLQEAQSVDIGVNNPGGGESAVVRTLLSVVEIWHNDRGVLSVITKQAGDEVYVDNQRIGLTPLTCALAPGQHALRVERNGNTVDNEQIEVKDGDQVERKIQ
jgi:hypothetical protein